MLINDLTIVDEGCDVYIGLLVSSLLYAGSLLNIIFLLRMPRHDEGHSWHTWCCQFLVVRKYF